MATKKPVPIPFDEMIENAVKKFTTDSQRTNDQKKTQESILAELDRLGGSLVKDDAVQFVGTKVVLPSRFSGDLLGAAEFLQDLHEQEESYFDFSRVFKYRPWDGAAAFNRALYRVFGTTGLGKVSEGGLFSPQRNPQLRTVSVGPNETTQVPWGEVILPMLDATFDLGGTRDAEYGLLFVVGVTAPRKRRGAIETFFNIVQEELEQRSIYKGKAFNGADDPEFLNLSGISESKIVYSDEVIAQLNANLWALIEHTDTMREIGIPLKRAVLLEGPYGTGKTLAGGLTAQKAIQNGWTFILARPGKDNIFEVLNTAKLYAPAVVQFEDIDIIANGDGSNQHISQLLDVLDGISTKSSGVVALFTTNHVEKIQKGVMRPGRIDSVIHIGALDRNGTEKLIVSVTDSRLLGDIDYDVVYAETHDFYPAFVKETVDRAVRYAIARNNGKLAQIETEDLVNSAIGLRRQLELMHAAQEGKKETPSLDAAFGKIVHDVVDQADVLDIDGDPYLKVQLS